MAEPNPRSTINWTLAVLVAAAGVLLGAVAGLVVGVTTPAHTEIAGSETRVWVEPGRAYDQVGVQGVVSLKRATSRHAVGEPLGVRAVLALDTSQLVDERGQIDPDVLPAYIQAYSDPQQLVIDIRHALLVHLVVCTVSGASIGLLLVLLLYAYRAWRLAYDHRHWAVGERAAAREYRAPERRAARRVLGIVLLVAVIGVIPSARRTPPAPANITGEAIFAGGPLAGVEVDGLLRPALLAAENYIQKYFSQTDAYYDDLRAALIRTLDDGSVLVPSGGDIATVGFVTDRHCNTGMDRVTTALLKRFGVRTLVSAGDDAFSGTFSFEAACTRNLAEQSHAAGITDVFAGGNHDSPKTIGYQRQQGIRTLTGSPVRVHGLTFLGSPDPRSSRYGQGIEPSSPQAQAAVIADQGDAIARTACGVQAPIIAVLHDPRAGYDALEKGCAHVTLALDGHTHKQKGPNEVSLGDESVGYQFTGGSSGGAPRGSSTERDFASRLTVGPLNHTAYVEIASINRVTGQLVAMTEFRFAPDQQVSVTQQRVGS